VIANRDATAHIPQGHKVNGTRGAQIQNAACTLSTRNITDYESNALQQERIKFIGLNTSIGCRVEAEHISGPIRKRLSKSPDRVLFRHPPKLLQTFGFSPIYPTIANFLYKFLLQLKCILYMLGTRIILLKPFLVPHQDEKGSRCKSGAAPLL